MTDSDSRKKNIERNILQLIYKPSEYSIIEFEKPDFILEDKNGNKFGVEITQLFLDESSARLKNKPNYLNDIIQNNKLDKRDVGILNVGEIVAIDDNGNEIPETRSMGVSQDLPQSPNRIEVLKKLVSSKNYKLVKYDKRVQFIDLIIYNDGSFISGLEIQKQQILSYLKKQESANTLISSFRKIVFIIKDLSKTNANFILHLKK